MTPATEISNRLKKLRAAMRSAKLGAFYLSKPEDVHYFSGFTGSDSALLVSASKSILLTDSRYSEEAQKSSRVSDVQLWKKHPAEFAGGVIKKMRVKSVGISAAHLPHLFYEKLAKSAKKVKLSSSDQLISDIRAIKSGHEISCLKKALRCAEMSFEAMRSRLTAGMSETDIRLELEWEMRKRGASDTAFETIVAVGANASLPHAHAGKRVLKSGGMVLIDFGAKLGYYNSDLTRVLFLGSISPLWKKRYELVLEAQAEGIKMVQSGVLCAKADEAARKVFRSAEAEKYFTHSLGHGVGLEVHEAPRLSRMCKDKLLPNMVVTVEPGIYYPRSGGIRIEDMVLVKNGGRQVLSRLPKSLEWAVV